MENSRKLFTRNARTFSFASFFLPKAVTTKIHTLYEFCRRVDDIADETADYQSSSRVLESFRSDISLESSNDEYIQAFIEFIRMEGLDKTDILGLLDGVISDCRPQVRIVSESELINYCAKVAGTVGSVLCPLLGVKESVRSEAFPCAVALGIAMQLTNMARDIKEDAERNRIYIPTSWFEVEDAQSLTREPIEVSYSATEACKKLLILADRFYSLAWCGYAYLPLSSRVSVLVAAGLYKAIGEKLKKNGFAYWRGRVSLTGFQKSIRTLLLLPQVTRLHFWFPAGRNERDAILEPYYVNHSV